MRRTVGSMLYPTARGPKVGLWSRAGTGVAPRHGEEQGRCAGYDFGYGQRLTSPCGCWQGPGGRRGGGGAASPRTPPAGPLRVLLLFTASNILIALFALPEVQGNPRYLLFLMAPLPILLAWSLAGARLLMALLVVFGMLGSLGQVPASLRSDAQWRRFVASLQAEGVRFCYTDFFLASKINFLSEERIVCSAKLGPTTTEYFGEYRSRRQEAALMP